MLHMSLSKLMNTEFDTVTFIKHMGLF